MSRKTRKLLPNIKKIGKLSKRLNQCQTKIYKPNDLLIHYAGYTWNNMDFSNCMKDNFFNSLKSLKTI